MKYIITFIADIEDEPALLKAIKEQTPCKIEGVVQQAHPWLREETKKP